MNHYVIGVDFGTLSARAAVVDVQTGQTMASAVCDYPHGVMDKALPDGTPLPAAWALQHPQDYLDVLLQVVPDAICKSGVPKEQIIAIGTDFTASTAMPMRGDGTPLCLLPEYAARPHAYAKLWKHHAAQDKADHMTRIAQNRQEDFIKAYGNQVSSEWSLPKLWEVMDEAPDIYDAMDAWMEAGDWITWKLCGVPVQNGCAAGYKYFHTGKGSEPSPDYFATLDEKLRRVLSDKYPFPILPSGSKAGTLTADMAHPLGLCPGIAVAVSAIDAHVGVLAAGIAHPGQMLTIIGTSSCHMVLGDCLKPIPGISGAVLDGIVPGVWCYEAGQSSVGDAFAWLTERMTPPDYHEKARAAGLSLHQYLTQLAQMQRPGQSGLLALDWWNGNRTVLANSNLTGMILGLTLQTTPEEIYRSLIESTAYGARMIRDTFTDHGLAIDEYYVTGGISQKNPMAMQIYADVLNLPVHVMDAPQGGALGSAILGAIAAGSAQGGYDTFQDAMAAMSAPVKQVYMPISDNAAVYQQLYQEFVRLHDYFGRGENNVMLRLQKLRQV